MARYILFLREHPESFTKFSPAEVAGRWSDADLAHASWLRAAAAARSTAENSVFAARAAAAFVH